MYSQYHYYIQQLLETIHRLEHNHAQFKCQTEDKLKAMKEENENIKKRLDEIKPIHIENINYKIQELDVKELSGTLNIGMTALSDPEKIKQWMSEADESDVHLNDMEQSPFHNNMYTDETMEHVDKKKNER